MKLTKTILGLGGVLLFAAANIEAAVVYLKDGSRLRGTVVSATARDIQLHTHDGILNITTDRIQSINYAEGETAASSPEATVPAPSEPAPYRRYTQRSSLVLTDLRHYFSVSLGAAIPLSDIDFGETGGGKDKNGDVGFLTGVNIFITSIQLGLGMNLEFFNRGSESNSLLPSSVTDVYGHSVLFLAGAKYSLTDQGTARPYIYGGIGPHRTNTTIEARPHPGFIWDDTSSDEWRTLVDDSHWGLATSLRLGVDLSWADPSVFSLELGWTRLSGPRFGATPSGQDLGLTNVTGNQNAIFVAARWGWRF